MDKFMKSLLLGAGASILLIGGIAGLGLWLNAEPSAATPVAVAQDNKIHTVRMRPQTVQIGGFSLKSKEKPRPLLVSVSMRVTGGHNMAKICHLMPRLVSSLNAAFANLASYTDSAHDAITGDLPGQLAQRFNRALGERVVEKVTLSVYQDRNKVPDTNCPEAT
tara:strand:- start:786 stop:1277 length:492 start_codon:yes stop_codon:yes gene_type:complete